jgi:malonyl CoA-acyl carrier protein transacylase
MGKELIEEFPSFSQTIEDLDNILQALPEAPTWTLRQAILDTKDVSQINHVTRSQPVCTAIQVAYVQLLSRWGIQPEAVIGHSSGEIGAAFASGFLSATEAIIVAYYRGYVVGKSNNPVKGGMMAAGLGKDQARSEIDALGLTNVIKAACINSRRVSPLVVMPMGLKSLSPSCKKQVPLLESSIRMVEHTIPTTCLSSAKTTRTFLKRICEVFHDPREHTVLSGSRQSLPRLLQDGFCPATGGQISSRQFDSVTW